jgi:response regulator of citrate/malate metabolism
MTTKRPWRVLIVEDDPVIALVYKRTVDGMGPFTVVGTVTRGEDALAFLQRNDVELMLLDLTLAGMSGLTLLQKLRGDGHPVEVIALTATRSAPVVRAVVQRGAIDYLVKPFMMDRLRQSLSLFLHRAAAMQAGELDQDAVNQICASGRAPKRWLPKGLSDEGLSRVTDAVATRSSGISAVEVAKVAGVARVTARRYLEYLVATGQLSVDTYPLGPGRPRKLYRTIPSSARIIPPAL